MASVITGAFITIDDNHVELVLAYIWASGGWRWKKRRYLVDMHVAAFSQKAAVLCAIDEWGGDGFELEFIEEEERGGTA